MAGQRSTTRRAKPTTLQCIAGALLAVIVVVVIIIILWVVLRPKLRIAVDHAAVVGFNFTADSSLNGRFDLTVRAFNRYKRAGLYYEHIAVEVWFSDVNIAEADVPGFYQPPENDTRIDVAAPAASVALPQDVERDMKKDRSGGKLPVEVRVLARVRVRLGVVKSRYYKVRASCPTVTVDLASPTTFDRVYCHVHI